MKPVYLTRRKSETEWRETSEAGYRHDLSKPEFYEVKVLYERVAFPSSAVAASPDVAKMVEAVANAALGDIHTITAGKVLVFLDIDKPGRNAFDQFRNRIAVAIDALGATATQAKAEGVQVAEGEKRSFSHKPQPDHED